MGEPEPYRDDFPPHVLAAVKTISRPVWGDPYRLGHGPAHWATGPYWPAELLRLAKQWERQAAAARVVSAFMAEMVE